MGWNKLNSILTLLNHDFLVISLMLLIIKGFCTNLSRFSLNIKGELRCAFVWYLINSWQNLLRTNKSWNSWETGIPWHDRQYWNLERTLLSHLLRLLQLRILELWGGLLLNYWLLYLLRLIRLLHHRLLERLYHWLLHGLNHWLHILCRLQDKDAAIVVLFVFITCNNKPIFLNFHRIVFQSLISYHKHVCIFLFLKFELPFDVLITISHYWDISVIGSSFWRNWQIAPTWYYH